MVEFPQRFWVRPTSRPHRVFLSFSVLSLLLFVNGARGAFPITGGPRAVFSRVLKSLRGKKSSFQLPQQSIPSLNQDQPVSKEMNGGELHAYKIILAKDQFLHVVVEQQGINVALALFDPDQKLLGEMDSPNNTLGPEGISLVAEMTGEYRLEVRSTENWANPGHYVVSVTEFRPATPADLKRVAAERGFMEAEHYSDPKEDDLQKQKMSLAQSRQRAIETYETTLAEWRILDDPHGEAMTYYRLGANYKLLGDFDKAIENFDNGLKALKNRASEQDWRLAAGILNDEGVVCIRSDVQKALELFEQAKRLFEAHNDSRGLASSYNNVGVAQANIGNMHEALDNYLKSLPIRKAEHQHSSEINLLNNIGGIYDSFGDPHLALDYYSQALNLWRQSSNRDKIPVGLNNVAKVQDELGEWQEARKNYEEALSLYRGDKAGAAATYFNLGGLYDTLGDPDQALEKYNAALDLLRTSVKDKRLTANVLIRIGQVNISFGKLDDALKIYNEALNEEGQLRPREPGRRASTLTGIGAAIVMGGNPQLALESYQEALKLRREVGDRRGEAVALDKMGEAYALIGDSQKALESFELAVPIWRVVEDRLGLASSLRGIARVELARGNLVEALKLSDEAMAIVEGLRVNVSSQQLRTSYFATKQNYYQLVMDLNMRLYRQNQLSRYLADALQASERARARSLVDTLGEARGDVSAGASENLLRLQRRLQAKSEAQTILLSSRHNEHEAEAIAREMINLIREYDEARDQNRAASPKYANLTRPQPSTLPEIQRLLDPDTLLLEYSLGEERSYVWAVASDSIKGFELPARKEIESTAQRLIKSLTERNRTMNGESAAQWQRRREQADAEFNDASAALGKMVLEPVAPLLGNKRLVVVADGALQLVSFAALPVPGIPVANSQRRLLDDHEIVYEPSASVLALQRGELANRKPAPHAVAVLANPVFDKDDPRVKSASGTSDKTVARTQSEQSSTASLQRGNLERDVSRTLDDIGLDRFPSLPSSAAEAQDIMRVAPRGESKAALDFDANRTTAMSGDLSKYRIVHFATHGVLDYQHPELSGIVLSMVDQRGQPQDGYLRLHDIYNLNLPADLVVLSACQTGVGKQIKGEGLIALTRGFMYAGAARVVASLWKVDDQATAQLMAEFYKQMFTDGQTPAAALRAAQRKLSQQPRWRSPYYWAGFVLQGEWK